MGNNVERNSAQIDALSRNRPAAFHLARLCALATRIDSPLVRRLRHKFLTDVDVGAEADLWFSPLMEARSPRGLRFRATAAMLLRNDLANDQPLLKRVYREIRQLHADESESIRLEERVTYLALRKTPDPRAQIEKELHRALRALRDSGDRGLEIARWALRALPRLPDVARNSEAAMLLTMGAAQHLGGRMPLDCPPSQRGFPRGLKWIVPAHLLQQEPVKMGLRLYEEFIEFVKPDGSVATFKLPPTKPGFVELVWDVAGSERVQVVQVEAGRRVLHPAPGQKLRIRTLTGDEYALETTLVEGAGQASEGDEQRLRQSTVKVLLDRQQWGVGYFVRTHRVLTAGHYYFGSRRIRVPEKCEVVWHERTIEATVVAQNSTFALLELEEEIEDAVILPRRIDAGDGPETREFVSYAGEEGTVRGRIELPYDYQKQKSEDWPPSLSLQETGAFDRGPASISGCPVVVDGAIAGQLDRFASRVDPPDRGYAWPLEDIEKFLMAETGPVEVYVSSTVDLRTHRKAVIEATERLKMIPIAMEDFVASSQSPETIVMSHVRGCDIFVLLVGFQYGYRPEGSDVSVIEFEYREAIRQGIPILIFLADESAEELREQADEDISTINRFREELRKYHLGSFSTPQDLASSVSVALAGYQLGGEDTEADDDASPDASDQEEGESTPDRHRPAIYVAHAAGAKKDGPLVSKLIDHLHAEGFDTLVDDSIATGESWGQELNKRLAECDGAILLIDKQALSSDVLKQTATILVYRKQLSDRFLVVPVLIGVSVDDVQVYEFAALNPDRIQSLQFPHADEAARELDRLVDPFRQLQAHGRPSFLEEKIRELLKDLPRVRIHEASERLSIAQGADPDPIRTLAIEYARQGLPALLESLPDFGDDLPRDSARHLVDLLAPLWVDAEAAAKVLEVSQRALGRRLLCVNATRKETADMYIRRALPAVPSAKILHYLAYGEQEDWSDILDTFRAGMADGLGVENHDVDVFLQRETQPVFNVFSPERLPEPWLLDAIRSQFPSVTLFVLSGEKLPNPKELGIDEIEIITPELEPRIEQEAHRTYAKARKLLELDGRR